MAQFGRPDGVISASGWSGTYADIDETTANDADYIESPSAPTSAQHSEYSITDLVDPVSSTGHVFRYRYGKSASGGARIDLTVSLRQGASTVIATATHTDISDTPADGELTLSAGEADSITDYTDLRLRFLFEQV